MRDWRAVREFANSPASLLRYLQQLDSGAAVNALMTAPQAGGQIAYNAAMDGFNFHRNRLPLSEIAEQLLRYAQFAQPPAVAAQSALIRDCLPAFSRDNALTLFDETILPRIWLGNRITTPTHVDEWNNVACVVAGSRRFTLFPPEQVANAWRTLAQEVTQANFPRPLSRIRVRRPADLVNPRNDAVEVGDLLRERIHLSEGSSQTIPDVS